ncbi:molecular chaperone [Gayadomonas joobiniege]|uniref:fimbrial biogenesis chaperone n=1 Tax=Gayadomonas joobiniege TaxID=1234606 RepID=UPI000A8B0823|nr:fimbria/pilus periplasmic chaperone [Gayadomonas joobiniege]
MLKTILICIFFNLFMFNAKAELLISPTRVVMDERQRSASVNLINTTQMTRTYRLSLVDKVALPNGGYQNIASENSSLPVASPYIRISPSQVTLKPGQQQKVRLLFRRPADLTDGEYRTHLTFTPLPRSRENTDNNGEMKIFVEALVSFSIPVLARQGRLDVNVEFADVNLVQQKAKKELLVKLARSGKHSPRGNLKIYAQTNTGELGKIVGQLNGLSLYPENESYVKTIVLNPLATNSKNLVVRYEGVKEFNGQILAEQTLSLD